MTRNQRRKENEAKISALETDIHSDVSYVLKELEKMGFSPRIIEGKRKPENKKDKSLHTKGLAIDVTDAENAENVEFYKAATLIFNELGWLSVQEKGHLHSEWKE